MQIPPAMVGTAVRTAGALPGGNRFQFFPVQVGGPTAYARSRKWIFVAISIFQLLMAIMALIEFANFVSGIIMLLGCFIAWTAVQQDMNVTYVCWFGVVCTLGFIVGMVGAFMGFAVKISTIIVKFNIPVSCFFGMILAWFIYSDYQSEHPEANDMVGGWLRAFGALKPKAVAPAGMGGMGGMSATLLSKGQLPQFGGGGFDSIKGNAAAQGGWMQGLAMDKMGQAQGMGQGYADQAQAQAGAYGAMGQQQAGAMGAMGQQQAGAWGAMGQQQMGSAQALGSQGPGMANSFFGSASAAAAGAFGSAQAGVAGAAEAVPEGKANVRADPFMTHS